VPYIFEGRGKQKSLESVACRWGSTILSTYWSKDEKPGAASSQTLKKRFEV